MCVGDLKKQCETVLGVVSQCCLTKHVFKMSKQYLANVALKINVKVLSLPTPDLMCMIAEFQCIILLVRELIWPSCILTIQFRLVAGILSWWMHLPGRFRLSAIFPPLYLVQMLLILTLGRIQALP